MTSVTDAPALSDERAVRKGIAIMLAGFFVFAFMNAIVKDLAATFPVNQIVFFRGLFGLVPLAVLLAVSGVRPTLTPGRALAHLPHGIVMGATLLLAYHAFALLPLAEVTAIFFLQPVLVALISAVFLRERIAPRLWAAVGGGFIGVLLIARPAGVPSDVGVFVGLAATLTGAITMFQQKALSRTNDTLEIVFWFMALSALLTAPSLLYAWVPPTPGAWATLAIMGVVSCIGQFLIILPLRYATAARLAPVYYTNLLGGLLFGWLWFGEVPDGMMLAGCAVVIAATALVIGAKPTGPAPSPAPAVIDAVEAAD